MANSTITMPDTGDDKPVEVIEILVSVGDDVAEESSVITIESDKATMDVPAPSAGSIVELKVAIGDQIKVGDEIAVINVTEANSEASNPPASPGEGSVEAEEPVSATDSENEVSIGQSKEADVAQEAGEPIAITMPDLGDDNPVEVIEIIVAVGDEVAEESSVITIESDKATMDVPTPTAGTIVELKVAIGDKVKSGDEIAVMQPKSAVSESQASDSPSSSAASPAEQSQTEPQPAKQIETKASAAESKSPQPAGKQADKQADNQSSGNIYSSPSVRRIAREWGIDLKNVSGSGRKGRILKGDMQEYVRQRLSEPAGSSGAGLPPLPQVDHSKFGPTRSKSLSKIRKLSASNLHASWVNIPHVTQHYRADISDLETARKGHNLLADTKLTPLAYLLKACAVILGEMEDFNSSLNSDGSSLTLKDYIHIGFACDTPNGLVVPVIEDVDKKSLSEIATEAGQLAAKARDGKLMPKQMQGGCFTISSLGHIGGNNNGPDYFSPIVNAPQVAILGVSRSKTEPQWNGQEFEPRLMLPLSLSYDHRVIDGVAAGKFVHRLGEILANWE